MPWTWPQQWDVFDEGKDRSASTKVLPYRGHSQRSCRRSSPSAASEGPRRRARAPRRPLRPSEATPERLRALELGGHLLAGRDRGQPSHADVDADDRAGLGAPGLLWPGDGDLHRGDEPVSAAWEGDRAHLRPPERAQPLDPAGALLCADGADHRQGQVTPVVLQGHRPGREGEAVPILAALLEPGEADPAAALLARRLVVVDAGLDLLEPPVEGLAPGAEEPGDRGGLLGGGAESEGACLDDRAVGRLRLRATGLLARAGERLLCPVGRRPLAVEAGAERGEDLSCPPRDRRRPRRRRRPTACRSLRATQRRAPSRSARGGPGARPRWS